jgi:hypothetical protein
MASTEDILAALRSGSKVTTGTCPVNSRNGNSVVYTGPFKLTNPKDPSYAVFGTCTTYRNGSCSEQSRCMFKDDPRLRDGILGFAATHTNKVI